MLNAGDLRAADAPGGTAGQLHRQRRFTVIAVPEIDDLLVAGIDIGDQEGGFVGVGAGCAELENV